MNKLKVCKKCNERLPATLEYFYKVKGNNDGLHGTCKECRTKQTRKAAKKRREEGRHLIHDLVCDWCGIDFKGDTEHRRFCSTDCQYTWQRESKEYRTIHKNNGLKSGKYNQYGSPEERENRFKKQFESKYLSFEYYSEFKGSEDAFKMKCRICGHVQERNAQIVRPSRNEELQCDNCNELVRVKKELIKELINVLNKQVNNLNREIKTKIQPEVSSLRNIAANHKHYIECIECGEKFFSRRNKNTCSDKCSKRRQNRIKEIKRRHKLRENGRIDWNITLDKLIKRDKRICYMCNKEVDTNDYIVDEDGTFISGNNYPSIDHVIPVSKGGTHTWDNVKLAHRHCNTMKSNDLAKPEDNGQLKLII